MFFLLRFELLNEGCGGEWGAAAVKGPETCGFIDSRSCSSTGFYMFITSGSGGPACLRPAGQASACLLSDGHINTSRCCFRCQTVCRWRRRRHGPTEAGRLRLWVSASLQHLSVWFSVSGQKHLSQIQTTAKSFFPLWIFWMAFQRVVTQFVSSEGHVVDLFPGNINPNSGPEIIILKVYLICWWWIIHFKCLIFIGWGWNKIFGFLHWIFTVVLSTWSMNPFQSKTICC